MKKKFFCALLIVLCFAAQSFSDEKPRVGVFQFQSAGADIELYYSHQIGDIFTQRLAMSDGLSVMGATQLTAIATEHKIPLSGYFSKDTAIEIGKLAECRYVVVGTVTKFKMVHSSSGVWIAGSHKEEASTEADVRVYDVQTGETLLADTESGKASQSGGYVSIYGMSGGSSELNGMQSGAISELTAKLSARVREALTGDTPKVTAKSAKEVTIDIGTIGGAAKGVLYRIYTGSGKKEQNLAVVKVKEAKSDYCTATLADKNTGNLALVQKGDKVFPIGDEELKALVKKKGSFVKSRPRATSSDEFDEMLKPSESDTETKIEAETETQEEEVKETKTKSKTKTKTKSSKKKTKN